MSFDAIRAQDPAVTTLKRALETGRVHHAYRFEGPDGVGKEMAAMALAQSLVCEGPGPLACNSCSACRRAITFNEEPPDVPLHPDVVLVQRGLYEPAMLGTSGTETTAISVHQIRRIVLGRAGYPPHEGRALVFIVRAADELTVQAANALLKTLEEPHASTYFVLLTSRPSMLLDTVKSRTLPVRFGPLPEKEIAKILEASGADPAAARLAEGSVSRALALADADVLSGREAFSRKTLDATEAHDLCGAIAVASEGRDRAQLLADLHHLGYTLAFRAREAVDGEPRRAERIANQHHAVMEAIDAVHANAQGALVVESLVMRMRRA